MLLGWPSLPLIIFLVIFFPVSLPPPIRICFLHSMSTFLFIWALIWLIGYSMVYHLRPGLYFSWSVCRLGPFSILMISFLLLLNLWVNRLQMSSSPDLTEHHFSPWFSICLFASKFNFYSIFKKRATSTSRQAPEAQYACVSQIKTFDVHVVLITARCRCLVQTAHFDQLNSILISFPIQTIKIQFP